MHVRGLLSSEHQAFGVQALMLAHVQGLTRLSLRVGSNSRISHAFEENSFAAVINGMLASNRKLVVHQACCIMAWCKRGEVYSLRPFCN